MQVIRAATMGQSQEDGRGGEKNGGGGRMAGNARGQDQQEWSVKDIKGGVSGGHQGGSVERTMGGQWRTPWGSVEDTKGGSVESTMGGQWRAPWGGVL